MNARIARSDVRARIAACLLDCLAEVSHAEIGRMLGVASTTILRRVEAGTLHAWPADDLLALSGQIPALGEQVRLALHDDEIEGNGRAAPETLRALDASMASSIAATLTALADGRLTRAESLGIRDQLLDLSTRLRHAIADVQAGLEAVP
jgi:hypothetical protein